MNGNLTEIIFLLDRSGSMGGLEKETINGFNAFLEKQSQYSGEIVVTTVLFDDEYEILWNGVNARSVHLTEREYDVRGCTALLDAIGKTIYDVGNRLSNTNEAERPGKVHFVITTDGLENASREFSYEKVSALIKHHQEKYNWDFIFLGANIDTAQEANRLGIHKGNAYSFEASTTGVETMYDLACEAVFEKRLGR